jgi:hypothetical protein
LRDAREFFITLMAVPGMSGNRLFSARRNRLTPGKRARFGGRRHEPPPIRYGTAVVSAIVSGVETGIETGRLLH